MVRAELDIHLVEPMEASSLYFLFNIWRLVLNSTQNVFLLHIYGFWDVLTFFACEGSYVVVLCFYVAVGGAGGGAGIPLAAGGYQGQNAPTFHLTCKIILIL